MGTQNISLQRDDQQSRKFERALISDLRMLEQMLKLDVFESGIRRIGAEQELVLIDQTMRPSCIGERLLSTTRDARVNSELAKFNLEINATPILLTGSCFQELYRELDELLQKISTLAHEYNSEVLLTGILPTLRPSDLTLSNMTNLPRYRELNGSLMAMRGGDFLVHIKGIDELVFSHNSMMMEACNTSFQIHYQVDPGNFVVAYNIAQAVSAPLLAACANSPLLFSKRLWNETRLPLLQHSIDERNQMEQQRFRPTRATFGDDWLHGSVLDLFKENVARFRTLLTMDPFEDPEEALSEGHIPDLNALRLHNSTVWRWNRPCYGILNGRPSLRIENRVLSAGPTLIDETANAAFLCGMMAGMEKSYPPIHNLLGFDSAKENFFSAARHGLQAQFTWIYGRSFTAQDLILNELLPLAHAGLKLCAINDEDRNEYLGIVEERVRSGKTGARWMLDCWSQMREELLPDTCNRALTENMLVKAKMGQPVHRWESGTFRSVWKADNFRYVGQIMSTDLYTVRPQDLTHLAACIMDWRHIRHLPVEDADGKLIGLLSQRDLLRHFALSGTKELAPVESVMKRNPISVSPDTLTLKAMGLMREKKVGCLPVVENGRLVGILTTYDLLAISFKRLEGDLE